MGVDVSTLTKQIIISGVLAAYVFLTISLLPVVTGKLLQFIVNIFLHNKGVHVKLGLFHISWFHLKLHLQNVTILSQSYSINVADAYFHYKFVRNSQIQNQKQLEQYVQQNVSGENNFELPSCPFVIEVSGLQAHIFSRELVKQVTLPQIIQQIQVIPQIPAFFKIIPAVEMRINGVRIVVGSELMRLMLSVEVPTLQAVLGCVKAQSEIDPYQLVVEGALQTNEKFKQIKVQLVENDIFPTNAKIKSIATNKLPVQLGIPILQSECVRFSVNSDQGGLHGQNCKSQLYDDSNSPLNQINVRCQKCCIALSCWTIQELLRLMEYYLPNSYDLKNIINIQEGVLRVARSLCIGIYFDNETPIVFWHRNTDLPYQPELVDPILWWKQNFSTIINKNLSYFSQIQGEMYQNEEEDIDGQNDVKKKFKLSQIYALLNLNYDDLLRESTPEVPLYKQYFEQNEIMIIKLQSKSQCLIRKQSAVLKYGDDANQIIKNDDKTGIQILVKSPSCKIICDKIKQETVFIDDFEFQFNIYSLEEGIKAPSFTEIGLNGRNLRFDLSKLFLNQILHFVTDFTEQDHLRDVYHEVYGIDLKSSEIEKNISFSPGQLEIQCNFANYEISINEQSNNCYQSLNHLSKQIPTFSFLQNEIKFAFQQNSDENQKYYQSNDHCRLSHHSSITNGYNIENKQLIPMVLKKSLVDPFQGLNNYSLKNAHIKYEDYAKQIDSVQNPLFYNQCFDKNYGDNYIKTNILQVVQDRQYIQVKYPKLCFQGSFLNVLIQSQNLQLENVKKDELNYRSQKSQIKLQSDNVQLLSILPVSSYLSHYLSEPFYDVKIGHVNEFKFEILAASKKQGDGQLLLQININGIDLSLHKICVDQILRFVNSIVLDGGLYIHPSEIHHFNYNNNLALLYNNSTKQLKLKHDCNKNIVELLDNITIDNITQSQKNDTEKQSDNIGLDQSEDTRSFSTTDSDIKQLMLMKKTISNTVVKLNISNISLNCSENLFTEVQRLDKKPLFNAQKTIFQVFIANTSVQIVSKNETTRVQAATSPIKFQLIKNIGQDKKLQFEKKANKTINQNFFKQDISQNDILSVEEHQLGQLSSVNFELCFHDNPQEYLTSSTNMIMRVSCPNISFRITTLQLDQLLPCVKSLLLQNNVNLLDESVQFQASDIKNSKLRQICTNQQSVPVRSISVVLGYIECQLLADQFANKFIHSLILKNGIRISMQHSILNKNIVLISKVICQSIRYNLTSTNQDGTKANVCKLELGFDAQLISPESDTNSILNNIKVLDKINEELLKQQQQVDQKQHSEEYNSSALDSFQSSSLSASNDTIFETYETNTVLSHYFYDHLDFYSKNNCVQQNLLPKNNQFSIIAPSSNILFQQFQQQKQFQKSNHSSLEILFNQNMDLQFTNKFIDALQNTKNQINVIKLDSVDDIDFLFYENWKQEVTLDACLALNKQILEQLNLNVKGKQFDTEVVLNSKSEQLNVSLTINQVSVQMLQKIDQKTPKTVSFLLQNIVLEGNTITKHTIPQLFGINYLCFENAISPQLSIASKFSELQSMQLSITLSHGNACYITSDKLTKIIQINKILTTIVRHSIIAEKQTQINSVVKIVMQSFSASFSPLHLIFFIEFLMPSISQLPQQKINIRQLKSYLLANWNTLPFENLSSIKQKLFSLSLRENNDESIQFLDSILQYNQRKQTEKCDNLKYFNIPAVMLNKLMSGYNIKMEQLNNKSENILVNVITHGITFQLESEQKQSNSSLHIGELNMMMKAKTKSIAENLSCSIIIQQKQITLEIFPSISEFYLYYKRHENKRDNQIINAESAIEEDQKQPSQMKQFLYQLQKNMQDNEDNALGRKFLRILNFADISVIFQLQGIAIKFRNLDCSMFYVNLNKIDLSCFTQHNQYQYANIINTFQIQLIQLGYFDVLNQCLLSLGLKKIQIEQKSANVVVDTDQTNDVHFKTQFIILHQETDCTFQDIDKNLPILYKNILSWLLPIKQVNMHSVNKNAQNYDKLTKVSSSGQKLPQFQVFIDLSNIKIQCQFKSQVQLMYKIEQLYSQMKSLHHTNIIESNSYLSCHQVEQQQPNQLTTTTLPYINVKSTFSNQQLLQISVFVESAIISVDMQQIGFVNYLINRFLLTQVLCQKEYDEFWKRTRAKFLSTPPKAPKAELIQYNNQPIQINLQCKPILIEGNFKSNFINIFFTDLQAKYVIAANNSSSNNFATNQISGLLNNFSILVSRENARHIYRNNMRPVIDCKEKNMICKFGDECIPSTLFGSASLRISGQLLLSNIQLDFSLIEPQFQTHPTLVNNIIHFIRQFEQIEKQFKTNISKEQKMSLQYLSKKYIVNKIDDTQYEENKKMIINFEIHNFSLSLLSQYNKIANFSTKVMKSKFQRNFRQVNEKAEESLQLELSTQQMSLCIDDLNLHSKCQNKFVFDIDMAAQMFMTTDRKAQVQLKIKELQLTGNDYLFTQIMCILTELKQSMYYDESQYMVFPASHSFSSEESNFPKGISEKIIDFVEKPPISIQLCILIDNILGNLTFATSMVDDTIIKFQLPSIQSCISFVTNHKQKSSQNYKSTDMMQFYQEFLREQQLQYLQVNCKPSTSTSITVHIKQQGIVFPSEIFEFITSSIQHVNDDETIQYVTINGIEVKSKKTDSSMTSDEEYEVKQVQFNQLLEKKLSQRNDVILMIQLDGLNLQFLSSPLKHSVDQDLIFSTLVFDLQKVNLIVTVGKTNQIQLLCPSVRIYAMPNKRLKELCILQNSKRLSEFPSFAIPCLLQVNQLYFSLINSSTTNLFVFSTDLLKLQFSQQAVEHLSVIHSVWKDNIVQVTAHIKTMQSNINSQVKKEADTSVENKELKNSINFKLNQILIDLYNPDFFQPPTVIIQPQSRQIIPDENDAIIIAYLSMLQNQRNSKSIVSVSNSKTLPIICSSKFDSNDMILQLIGPEIDVIIDLSSHLQLNFSNLILYTQIRKAQPKLMHLRFSSKAISIKDITDVELCDVLLDGIEFETSFKTKFIMKFGVNDIKLYLGCSLVQSITKAFLNLITQFQQHWDQGQVIVTKVGLMQGQSIVIKALQVQNTIAALLSDNPKTQQEYENLQQSIADTFGIIDLTTSIIDYVTKIIQNEITIQINNIDIVLAQFNLADSLLLRTIINSFQLSFKLNPQGSNSKKLAKKMPEITFQQMNQPIGNETTQNWIIRIGSLACDIINRVPIMFKEQNIKDGYQPEDGYQLNGIAVLFCNKLLSYEKAYIKQNCLMMQNSMWRIVCQNLLLAIKGHLELNLDVDVETKPGQFQTGDQIMKLIDYLNVIVRDQITFFNSISQQLSTDEVIKKQQLKQQKKATQNQYIHGLKWLNADESSKVQVFLRVKSKNIDKLLPNIDMFGQGTGLIEQVARNLTSTSKVIEDLIETCNQLGLDIGLIVSRMLAKLFT